jgi:uncharacterized protein
MPIVNATAAPPPAWWTFGHVWLVIAGPAAVVVASFFTLYLAIARPDPLVVEDRYRSPSAGTLAPATEARNHAATAVAGTVAARP